MWIRAEALMWWTNDQSLPPLVSSSPLGTPLDDVGVLGLPTTTNVFDGPAFGDMRFGGRIRFGYWADECRHGIDGSLWGLGKEENERSWESGGNPAYARPFTNADPLVNGPDAQLVSFNGVVDGRVSVKECSEILGGDIGCRKNLFCCSDFCGASSTRLDCYLGYRYFSVDEGLRITENLVSTSLTGPTVLGTRIDLFDDFQTRNEFHGANIGFIAMQQRGRWVAEVVSRLAIGNLRREAIIDGATTVTVPTVAPNTRPGGLLTQASNIGVYEDNQFEVLPELQINLGYALSCNTRLTVGYNFMYLGKAIRPGDIIDTTVNGAQLDPTIPAVGPTRPAFVQNDSRMWLMGLNLGVAFNF